MKNRLREIFELYEKGQLSKQEYIDSAYEMHDILFQYAEWIAGTNISEIQIEDSQVLMRFGDSDLQLEGIRGDKRAANLDTLNFLTYEREELAMQLSLINESDIVLDVGGNYGWYTCTVAKARPKATIYTFEPIPSTFHILTRNVFRNNLKNVLLFNFALFDIPGFFEVYFDRELSVNASMKNVAEKDEIDTVQCFAQTLDSFVESHNIKVDFLKCDVEGGELKVFEGGKNTISDQKPVVFSEMLRKWSAKFNYHPNDIITYFEDFGYQCFTAYQSKLKRFREVTEDTEDTNYFFLHSEKHKHLVTKFS